MPTTAFFCPKSTFLCELDSNRSFMRVVTATVAFYELGQHSILCEQDYCRSFIQTEAIQNVISFFAVRNYRNEYVNVYPSIVK